MSKKTDYKQLWKREKIKNANLSKAMNEKLMPRLMRAEQVLLAIVLGEVDVDKMVEDYAKKNPGVKVKTTKEGKKYVVRTDIKPESAKSADKKPVS